MIRYIKGDITKSNCDIICHQVNCQGKMNSGVAKAIRAKWPKVYEEYCEIYKQFRNQNQSPLKMTLISDISKNQKIANMFAQEFYGYNGQRYTDYEAFYQCLCAVRNSADPQDTFAFPYKIGCVRGGANWNIIKTMVEEVFVGRDVTFYYLNEDDLTWKEKFIIEEYNRKVPMYTEE